VVSQAILKDILDWDNPPEYDMVWTDPPWETRMLRWFDTLQRKQTGSAPEHSLNEIIEKLASLIAYDKPAFVEYSTKGWQNVDRIIQAAGHRLGAATEGTQSNGRPFMILSYNTDYTFPRGLKGGQYITSAVKALQPKVVFDPFAGIGYTYRYVRAGGAHYIGSEINAARYERLAKAIG